MPRAPHVVGNRPHTPCHTDTQTTPAMRCQLFSAAGETFHPDSHKLNHSLSSTVPSVGRTFIKSDAPHGFGHLSSCTTSDQCLPVALLDSWLWVKTMFMSVTGVFPQRRPTVITKGSLRTQNSMPCISSTSTSLSTTSKHKPHSSPDQCVCWTRDRRTNVFQETKHIWSGCFRCTPARERFWIGRRVFRNVLRVSTLWWVFSSVGCSSHRCSRADPP